MKPQSNLPTFLQNNFYQYWSSTGQVFTYSQPKVLLKSDKRHLSNFIHAHPKFEGDIEIKDQSFVIKKSGILGPFLDFYGSQTPAAVWKRDVPNTRVDKRGRPEIDQIDQGDQEEITPHQAKRRLLLKKIDEQKVNPLIKLTNSQSNKKRVEKPKHIIGFEIEHLADWAAAGWIGILDERTGEFTSKIEYDAMLAETELDGLISLSADHNGYDDNLKAGIEFRTAPCFLGTNGETPLFEEQLKIIELFEEWLNEKKQELQEKLLDGKTDQQRKLRSSAKQINELLDTTFDLDIENFLDYYNENKPKGYKELLLLPPENASSKWIVRLSRKDLKQNTPRYSTQINASIPAHMIHSQEMRDLFARKHTYLIEDLEREPKNPDFHVMQDHEVFLEYEESVYKKAVDLTEKFFEQEKERSGSERKLRKVKAFLLKMAYEIAMVSTSTEQLMELFPDKSEEYVKSIGKDLFPMGLCKFSSRTFFTEMMSDEDREFILSIPRKNLETFCASAITSANGGKQQDSMVVKLSNCAKCGTFPVSHFIEYTLDGKHNRKANEIDPILMVMERVIKPAFTSLNKEGDREKMAGVVQFRVPEQHDHSFAKTQSLVRESAEKYSNFMEQHAGHTTPKSIEIDSNHQDRMEVNSPQHTPKSSPAALPSKTSKPALGVQLPQM